MTHHIRIRVIRTKEEDRDYRKLARALLMLVEHQQEGETAESPNGQQPRRSGREAEP